MSKEASLPRTLGHTHVPSSAAAFDHVGGQSMAIMAAIALARRVADHPTTTVLLHGETGTGKELFSRGIHYAGAHSAEPFVPVNCSAIPDNLIESELFGHERGAFTDARVQKLGLLELAGRGTLFLDEVEELPLHLQPKLLRVLEDRRVRRLGGLQEYDVGCRIIAATNLDLAMAVAEGRFREDLFYRLSVFRIELPALRMRTGDVDVLARSFVDELCREHGLHPKRLTEDTLRVLGAHPWPGNVRELRNTIERAVIICDQDWIEPRHIMIQRRTAVPADRALPAAPIAASIDVPMAGMSLAEVDNELIRITLRLTGNNHTRAAKLLGISRPTLLHKIRENGLEEAD